MGANRNTQLCWSCEGDVHVHAFQCPHCGADLSPQEQSTSMFAPPYKPSEAFAQGNSFPEAPYARAGYSPEATISDEEWEGVAPNESAHQEGIEKQNKAKILVLTTFLLSVGSLSLIFGLILALFSQDGVLTLRWNSSYWPLYLGLSAFSLFYGWQNLNRDEIA